METYAGCSECSLMTSQLCHNFQTSQAVHGADDITTLYFKSQVYSISICHSQSWYYYLLQQAWVTNLVLLTFMMTIWYVPIRITMRETCQLTHYHHLVQESDGSTCVRRWRRRSAPPRCVEWRPSCPTLSTPWCRYIFRQILVKPVMQPMCLYFAIYTMRYSWYFISQ